jgi:uncharacterized protein
MVICVVTVETINHPDELMAFFADLGCDSVGFNIEEQEGLNAHREQVTPEQAKAFWARLWQLQTDGALVPVRDLNHLRNYLKVARHHSRTSPAEYDPIPTVAASGDTVLLSPELLGVQSQKYANFIVGNVTTTSLLSLLSKGSSSRYVAEFSQALQACASVCEFWAFCQGAQAGNRFFEHGSFTVMETNHCRNSKQALVRAALDHITPRIGLP